MYLIFMGVSGAGKSTYAQMASQAFDLPFFEADDFHPPVNVEKMSAGTPLSNEDRVAWIEALCAAVSADPASGAVLSCSALNPFVRELLSKQLPATPTYIWLDVPEDVIRARMVERTDHFMPESLLTSQIEALEPPQDAIRIMNEGTPERVFEAVKAHLKPLFDAASGPS